jgi:hypothetical protein
MLADGHEVGNRGYLLHDYVGATPVQIAEDISAARPP